MSDGGLTEKQLKDVDYIERVCSSLSCIGCLFIILTFLCYSPFRKSAINRLVLYASIGNTFTNVATLISRSALSNPNGPLCQLQAFLIQMFMSADAYWTCAMACNVWLTFYRRYTAEQIRSMEKIYMVICYGIPFIPAVAYIWIYNEAGDRIYGDAVLWCWVTTEFNSLRMATFYGPVWVSIVLTLFIYIYAGRKIYLNARSIRSMQSYDEEMHSSVKPQDPSVDENKFSMKISNDVRVTSMAIPSEHDGHERCGADGRDCLSAYHQPLYTASCMANTYQRPEADRVVHPESATKVTTIDRAAKSAQHDKNNAAWMYTKVAILFFTAMLVTWIPSLSYRMYSTLYPGSISMELTYASAFVLPLQGFWNAVIYFTTSRTACRMLWQEIWKFRRPAHPSWPSLPDYGSKRNLTRKGRDSFDMESTVGLKDRGSLSEVPQPV